MYEQGVQSHQAAIQIVEALLAKDPANYEYQDRGGEVLQQSGAWIRQGCTTLRRRGRPATRHANLPTNSLRQVTGSERTRWRYHSDTKLDRKLQSKKYPEAATEK